MDEAIVHRAGFAFGMCLLALSVVSCVWPQSPAKSYLDRTELLSKADAETLVYLLPQAQALRKEGMDIRWDPVTSTDRKSTDFYEFWVTKGSELVGLFSVNMHTGDIWESTTKFVRDPELDPAKKMLWETHHIDDATVERYQGLKPETLTNEKLFLLKVARTKPHPSDGELKANFSQQQSGFENLLKMSKEDTRVVRIAPDFTWLDTDVSWPRKEIGFSEERWKIYRELFWKLKIPDGISHRVQYPSAVFFLASSVGIFNNGSSKGYVYSTDPLSPVRQSLDGIPQTGADAIFFELTSPNWYIFFEEDH
jgi:hypothetical protein